MQKKEIYRKPIYRFLLMLTIASSVGLQVWRTIFNNFAVEVAGANGFWIGVIQSVREIPGFIALLVVYLLLILREHRLSSYSVITLGAGVFLTGFFPSNSGLLVTTFIMSIGFHYFETTNQSLTLQYFNKKEAPVILARFRSIAALTNIGVGILILLIAGLVPYYMLFALTGFVVTGLGIFSLFSDPSDKEKPVQKKRMVFKRKYTLFYILNFLAGARRQIFIVFAVFLLVKHYNYSVLMVTGLFIINNLINYLFTPLIAKAINRFGEYLVLSTEYSSLILIFLLYGIVDNAIVAGFLYILDNMFFNFSIGIKTFFQKTGEEEDIAPSMAVGFTINHIAAVILPFIGGALWMIDRRIPFIAGSVLSLVSLIAVQFMRKYKLRD